MEYDRNCLKFRATAARQLKHALAAGVLFVLAGQPASAQPPPLTCTTNGVAPPILRAEGNAELVADIVLTCTGGNPANQILADFTVFLNTNVTSNLTGPGPAETEALLLIDEPKPSPAVNATNGFSYTGQVKGTPGVSAPAPGSGNVYTGSQTAAPNQLLWQGVPIVPPGPTTRILRFTNVRAVPPVVFGGPSMVFAFVTSSGPSPIPINNPTVLVGLPQSGLKFQATIAGPNATLRYTEKFASAFRKRIENTPGGPTSATKQNTPGGSPCTESGFNPDFTTTAPGDPGSANTATRLVAKFTSIPAAITHIKAPNSVTSSTGQLTARRVDPPYGVALDKGTLAPPAGFGSLPVMGGAVILVYEVLAAGPFQGVNGCSVLDTFKIPAQASPLMPLPPAKITGVLGPVDNTKVISGPAPEPRFF
jgi:hypothetical protein